MGVVISHGSPLFDALAGAGKSMSAYTATVNAQAEEERREQAFQADIAAAAQDLDARRAQEADRQAMVAKQEKSADQLRRGYEYIAKFQGNDFESGPAARAMEAGMSRDDVLKRLRREKLGTLTEMSGGLQPEHLEPFWQSALTMLAEDEANVEGMKFAEEMMGVPPEMLDPQVAKAIESRAQSGDIEGARQQLEGEVLKGVERQRAMETRLSAGAQIRSWAEGLPPTHPSNAALSTMAGLLESYPGADPDYFMREAFELTFMGGKGAPKEPFNQDQWALETLGGIAKSNPELLMSGEINTLYEQLRGVGRDPFESAFGSGGGSGADAFRAMAEKANVEAAPEGGALDLPAKIVSKSPIGTVARGVDAATSGPGGASLKVAAGSKVAETMLQVGQGIQMLELGADLFVGEKKRKFDSLLKRLADLIE